ncbi:FAD dependent oxidoreductase [Bombardia bombarda]|uniref:FAD dependent oxidoreductase n=1 Tax=Bombardia bombarda TaxID=252184 RepID=A0AA39WIF1_9PEZI|nr:FAD dependent oxidoreductase [Bombardia bombarda]
MAAITESQNSTSTSSQTAGLPSPNSSKPYWLKDPSPILLGHRTTAELPATADIVVVGSGITGAFAAHFLKNSGAKDASVVMLEAREACSGATGRNGGHCQPLVYMSAPHIVAFELATLRFLRDLVQANDIPCDWVTLTGVHTYLSQDTFDSAIQAIEQLGEKYPELAVEVEVVGPPPATSSSSPTATTTKEHEADNKNKPSLASLRIPDTKGAVIQKSAASLWPYKLVAWVLEQLLARFPDPGSFNLQTNTPVTGLQRQQQQRQQQQQQQQQQQDGEGWVVTTPRGTIVARQVLLATNGYTSHLLPGFADLLVPVRGQIGALVPPSSSSEQGKEEGVSSVNSSGSGSNGSPVKLQHSYIFIEHRGTYWRDDYLVQRPAVLPEAGSGGELIYGGGRYRERGQGVGEWRDDEVEEQVSRFLKTNLSPPLDLRPGVVVGGRGDGQQLSGSGRGGEEIELAARFEWTGIMGFSRDQHPWVGAVPESLGGGGEDGGLWLCAGYTGHGMPAAALSARAVVGMMTGAGRGTTDRGDVKLPEEFVVSEERAKRAREELDTVLDQSLKGWAAGFPELLAVADGRV